MSDFALIVLAAIVANLLTPTVKYLWRCVSRFVRRYYIWHESTQRLIDNRSHWRATRNSRKYLRRSLEVFGSNLLDIEYILWREDINKNNTRLFRQNVRTPRWMRHSPGKLEDYFVDPSYKQFLELKMDEDMARVLAENKPMGDAILKEVEKTNREYNEYKCEFDKHIEIIYNNERYKSVLHWGSMHNLPPHAAAAVYEKRSLSFPEVFHLHNDGSQAYAMGHIYRFLNSKFPKGYAQ